jgi:cardiolipin synthase (CMP-forming)
LSPTNAHSLIWLTWANGLTALRALMALPCAALVADERWAPAALLVTLAIVTDLLDGPLARRFNQATRLGGLLDHSTDAAFVALLLAALATLGYVPWLLPVLVVASFLQYVLDSRALQGKRLRASWLGRANGIAYFVLAAIPVYRGALGLAWPADPVIAGFAWLLVLTSAASMLDRLRLWRAAE